MSRKRNRQSTGNTGNNSNPGKTPQMPAFLPLGAMLTGMVLAPAFVHAADEAVKAAAGAEQTLPTVNVKDRRDTEATGYQGGTTRVGKVKQLPKDIPQAITIIPESLMKDTNANTLKEALRNVAGLTFNAAEGGRIGDNYNLRGFYSFGDLYMDGIRDVAQINGETFNLSRSMCCAVPPPCCSDAARPAG